MKAYSSPLSPGARMASTARRWAHLALSLAVANLTAAVLFFPKTVSAKEKSSLSREPGAIYIEDILDKPIKLKIKKDVSPPVFSQLDAKRRLGRMVSGSEVSIVAISEKAYRVRGKATHGGVSGWISPKYLEAKDPEFFAKMKKMYERQQKVQALIKAHEVGLGMTIEEVKESLGRPTATKSTIDKEGKLLTLDYTTFKRVPQTVTRQDLYGRFYNTTVYVKVPVGNRAIHFKNGAVVRIEEEIGEPPKGGLKMVPAPIELF